MFFCVFNTTNHYLALQEKFSCLFPAYQLFLIYVVFIFFSENLISVFITNCDLKSLNRNQ